MLIASRLSVERIIEVPHEVAARSGFLSGLFDFSHFVPACPDRLRFDSVEFQRTGTKFENRNANVFVIDDLSHDELALAVRCMTALHNLATTTTTAEELPDVVDPIDVGGRHLYEYRDTYAPVVAPLAVEDLVTLLRVVDFLAVTELRNACFQRLVKICTSSLSSGEQACNRLLGYPEHFVVDKWALRVRADYEPPDGARQGVSCLATELLCQAPHLLAELATLLPFWAVSDLEQRAPELRGMFGTRVLCLSYAPCTIDEQMARYPDTQAIHAYLRCLNGQDSPREGVVYPQVTDLTLILPADAPSAAAAVARYIRACPNVQRMRLGVGLEPNLLAALLPTLANARELRHIATDPFVPAIQPPTLRSCASDVSELINGALMRFAPQSTPTQTDFLTRADPCTPPLLCNVGHHGVDFLRAAILQHGVGDVVQACRRDRNARWAVCSLALQTDDDVLLHHPEVAQLFRASLFRWCLACSTAQTLFHAGDTTYEYIHQGRLHHSKVAFHAMAANDFEGQLGTHCRCADLWIELSPHEQQACLEIADSRGVTTLMWLSGGYGCEQLSLCDEWATSPTRDADGNTALHHLCAAVEKLHVTFSCVPIPNIYASPLFVQANHAGLTPLHILLHRHTARTDSPTLLRLLRHHAGHSIDLFACLVCPLESDFGPQLWESNFWRLLSQNEVCLSQTLLTSVAALCCALLAVCRRHGVGDLCKWRDANGNNLLHRIVRGLRPCAADASTDRALVMISCVMQLEGLHRLADLPNHDGQTPCDLVSAATSPACLNRLRDMLQSDQPPPIHTPRDASPRLEIPAGVVDLLRDMHRLVDGDKVAQINACLDAFVRFL